MEEVFKEFAGYISLGMEVIAALFIAYGAIQAIFGLSYRPRVSHVVGSTMCDSTPRLAAARPKGPFALAVAPRPVLWISTKQLLLRGAVVGVRRTAVMDCSRPRGFGARPQ